MNSCYLSLFKSHSVCTNRSKHLNHVMYIDNFADEFLKAARGSPYSWLCSRICRLHVRHPAFLCMMMYMFNLPSLVLSCFSFSHFYPNDRIVFPFTFVLNVYVHVSFPSCPLVLFFFCPFCSIWFSLRGCADVITHLVSGAYPQHGRIQIKRNKLSNTYSYPSYFLRWERR